MRRMAESNGRRGIQSVEIGMRVLSAVAEMSGPSSLSSIAQRAQISSSQTHRYLSSLMAAGMVLQEGRSGLYDLAAGAIRIGLAALSRMNAFVNADEIMWQLVRDTRRTGFIAVWGDSGPTIVRWFPGSPPVMTALTIGSTLPLLRSATGQVFHAFGERREMDRQARLIDTNDPAGVPSDIDKFRAAVTEAGYAQNPGDLVPGLRAIAAPVFDLQGNLVMVCSIIAGLNFPSSTDREAINALLAACNAISESIGAHPSEPPVLAAEPQPAPPRRGRRPKEETAQAVPPEKKVAPAPRRSRKAG
jgi:DNA-binding IclR family transcriptional regulator